MPGADRLQKVGLFTDVAPDVLAGLCAEVVEVALAAGEVLFEEGEIGDRAYVVVDGSVEIVKHTEGRDVVLAVQGVGQVVGEMALLRATARTATVKAREAAELVAIPKSTFDALLASSPESARAVFSGLVRRMDDTAEQLRHHERMAQLGTLTAGIAHELNNPAAAVQRSADSLADRLEALVALLLAPAADDGSARAAVWQALVTQSAAPAHQTPRSALARSDLEDAIADLLDDHDVAESWRLAPELVDAGFDTDSLAALLRTLSSEANATTDPDTAPNDADKDRGDVSGRLSDAVAFAANAAEVTGLVRGIVEASARLSHIVKALKGYAYLDRAPVQDVDVIEGLESTVVLLAHKLSGVRITRNYASDLPRITAVGGDLNQVWTNLIDNAADALAGHDAASGSPDWVPTLTLTTRAGDDEIIVEVTDNGPGIADDARRKIFDAFFTTKPPGSGTGLGLSTTQRIVVKEHHGSIECASQPGTTTFTVRLPIGHAREGSSAPRDGSADPPIAHSIRDDAGE